jgi:hypothetical protein
MKISLPKELTYPRLRSLMAQYYQRTICDNDTTCFDWRTVEWVLLPEVVALLSWSSKLRHMLKDVEWLLRDPSAPVERIDDLRFHAELSLGSRLYGRLVPK